MVTERLTDPHHRRVDAGLHVHEPCVLPEAAGNRVARDQIPWRFDQHGQSGLWLSELFPNLARHADDLCLINSMYTESQKFIESTLPKLRRLRELIDSVNPDCELEVDGGIDAATAPLVVSAGARVLVAGSAVFGAKDGVAAASQRILEAANHALTHPYL